MKKLMVFAALAALSMGAVADNCTPEIIQRTLVYCVKMNVKTTKGVAGSVTSAASVCEPGSGGTVTSTVIRVPDTTTFQGWIYDCVANCDTIATGSAVVWDSKRKAQLVNAAFTTTFINVIGKKQADAEWAWTFEGDATYDSVRIQKYTLTGAGLGKYSTKVGYYTSFSGNFAGTATASYDLKSSTICDPSQVWKCEALSTLVDSDTVAYGTWTAKYNAAASKKFNNNGTLTVPSYVTYTSGN